MRIRSTRVWIVSSFMPADLIIENNIIQSVEPYRAVPEADADYGDRRIVPGFIDVHTHGAYGFDTYVHRKQEESGACRLHTRITAADTRRNLRVHGVPGAGNADRA